MYVTSTIFRSRKSTTVRTIHAPSLYDELGLKRLGPLPWINLYGSWLTGLGFERGKRLKITGGWRRLVITVEED